MGLNWDWFEPGKDVGLWDLQPSCVLKYIPNSVNLTIFMCKRPRLMDLRLTSSNREGKRSVDLIL
jgi:hypothetical protein